MTAGAPGSSAGSGIGMARIASILPRRRLRKAHDDVEPPVAFEQLADALSADGDLHDVLDVADAEPVPRQGAAVELDGEDRQTCDLFGLHVGRPADALDHPLDLLGSP